MFKLKTVDKNKKSFFRFLIEICSENFKRLFMSQKTNPVVPPRYYICTYGSHATYQEMMTFTTFKAPILLKMDKWTYTVVRDDGWIGVLNLKNKTFDYLLRDFNDFKLSYKHVNISENLVCPMCKLISESQYKALIGLWRVRV